MYEIDNLILKQVSGGCISKPKTSNIITPVIIIGSNPGPEVMNTVNNLINNIFSIFK